MYACNTIMVAIPIADYNKNTELQKLPLYKKGNKYMYVFLDAYEEWLLNRKSTNTIKEAEQQ
jgi:hypothetical protein